MQRIIIVFNPRSSKQAKIRQEVIGPVQSLSGYQVGKFEVKQAPVEENAKNLARILMDGDLIIVAGGDGTATVGANAAMMTEAKVTIGVLGYGNFNDTAHMFGEKTGEQIISDFENGLIQKVYPLEARIDGRFFRYSVCYFSIGMFAESTEEFNRKDTRKKLKKGKKGIFYSIRRLAMWYFRNRKTVFLPSKIKINGEEQEDLSDILFVNSKTIAKIMKGGNYQSKPSKFFLSTGKLNSFFRLCGFMLKSFFSHVPGNEVDDKVLVEFPEESTIEIQAEGEYKKIKTQKIEVKKSQKNIFIVSR